MTAFFYLLVILGSLQGLVTAALLYFRKPAAKANRVLAFIVLLIALPGIHLYGHYAAWFSGTPATDLLHAIVPWVSVMGIGPLLLFYVRASVDPSFTIGKTEAFQLLPVVVDLFPKFMELLFLAGALTIWDRAQFMEHLDTYNKYADIPRWLSLAIYVTKAGRLLSDNHYEAMPGFTRLRRFVTAMQLFAGIWLLYLIPYLVPSLNTVLRDTVGWFPVYIPMAVLIYWTGITVVYHPQQPREGQAKKTETQAYPTELLQQTARRLIASMETDQAFLDARLDLPRLSQRIGVPAKLISATVNQLRNKSFNQFVNEYRVAAFKQKLLDPASRNMTITGLAASCGFSSTATFQRSFKQITGITPTEFLRSATAMAADAAQIRI